MKVTWSLLSYHVKSVVKYWSFYFHKCTIPEATLSAQYIVGHVIKEKNVLNLRHAKRVLSNSEILTINHMCLQRLKRKPVQAIIGEWDFRKLNLILRSPVFIPRPETEELVDLALNDLKNLPGACSVLDIGCGSGAIALSLAKEFPQVMVTAIDINPLACNLTQENAELLGLDNKLKVQHAQIIQDGFQGMENSVKYDMIISNPPYIRDEDFPNLEPEISRYEDHVSLRGGYDGLHVVRMILQNAANLLKQHGSLWLEVDITHPLLIKSFVQQNNVPLQFINTYMDFTRRPRFVHLKRTN